MDTMPEPFSSAPPPPPPPPPAKKSRTGMWIGIAAGVVLVCLCCVGLAVVGYNYRANIPGISGLFATPTPQGVYYTNSSLGISLYYPTGWVYEEQSNTSVVFATSQEVLSSPDTPTNGAAMGFIVSPLSALNLPSTVDPSSPESILNAFMGEAFSGSYKVLEGVRTYSLGSYPAASTVLLVNSSSTSNLEAYMTVLVSNGQIAIGIGITPEGQAQQYRSTFDQILSSFAFGG